jgi:methionyl-tRNA synthetase
MRTMSTKTLITAALPYANAPVHIGHLIEYIQADIITRFLKLSGENVIYICASDTHGTPIEVNAQKQGIKPEELVKKYNREHQKDFAAFHIQFDNYYTTHSPENKEFSEFFFTTLKKKGYIYTKTINVIYCAQCARTLPDRYVRGTCPHCTTKDQYGDVCESCGVALKGIDLINPKCSLCGSTPEQKEREHYFFKLSSFSEQLRTWLNGNEKMQSEIKNHITTWLDNGLEDWCISRDGPYFGFLIPGETEKYFYVWLDAPIGYISSTKNYTDKKNEKWEDYWKKNNPIIHFIGKDIIYFHFLFWPAMLMGVGFNVPDNIAVHGFLTVNGTKMSKSRGTFFTAQDFLKTYNAEYLRFYYAQHLSTKLVDIDLDFDDFKAVINNTLIANVGNFCYRVLSFAEKNYGGKLTKIADEKETIRQCEETIAFIKKSYAEYNIKNAVRAILALSAIGNSYFQAAAPWKDKQNKEIKEAVGLAANIVRVLSIVLQPILPVFAVSLQEQLGVKQLAWKDITFDEKIHVKNAAILLKKIEDMPEKMQFPLQLGIGKITRVEDHPNAENLYVLQVDCGTEKRQLVAGIKKFYTPDQLDGMHIVVCMNMKPAKLRGVESNGMLCAADDGEHVIVLEAPNSPPGTPVTVSGYTNSTKKVTYPEFAQVGLKVVDKRVVWKDKRLHTTVEELDVEGVAEGASVR